MAKVVKQKYIKADGSKAIYGYLIPIKKSQLESSNINPDKEIIVKVENGKLIISN